MLSFSVTNSNRLEPQRDDGQGEQHSLKYLQVQWAIRVGLSGQKEEKICGEVTRVECPHNRIQCCSPHVMSRFSPDPCTLSTSTFTSTRLAQLLPNLFSRALNFLSDDDESQAFRY